MLSLGVSESRISRPVLLLILPLAVTVFLLAEFIIPPAQQLARTERMLTLSSMSSQGNDSAWAQDGRQYLNVKKFGPMNKPIGIEIYSFAENGSLDTLIQARDADVESDHSWVLENVTKKRIVSSQLVTEHTASLRWNAFISPEQLRFLGLPLDSIPPVELYSHVLAMQKLHQKATRYAHAFWETVCIPVSMAAMVMIASSFVFGMELNRGRGQSLTYGMGFGIAFSLSQQVLNHLSVLLELSPAVGPLLPSLLTGIFAAYFSRAAG